MAAIPIAIFWICAGLLIYAHAGYPLLLALWARLRPWKFDRGDGLPEVTVVVVAHNEAQRIEARINNLLDQDYPRERLHIAIGSDGSTDGTGEAARAMSPKHDAKSEDADGVGVFEFGLQRGKPAVLNELIPAARGAIVVLADARQKFDRDALRKLVAPFADPRVGAVSGELLIETGESAGGSNLYWNYEKLLRKKESEIDSTVGATGAIYAIRRELFEPIPEDTVLDDMLIPLRISKRGFRVVFESLARANDVSANPSGEFLRKVRTLAGNFQLFSRETWLFNPFKNRLWLQTVSHKLLRLACPILLFGTLVTSAILARRGFYKFALIVQLLVYALALIGRYRAHREENAQKNVCPIKRPALPFRITSAAYLFCLLHWATVVGFLRYSRGQANATWKRVPAVRPSRVTSSRLAHKTR